MAMDPLQIARTKFSLEQAYFQRKFHRYRNGLNGVEVSLEEILKGAANGDALSLARRNTILQIWRNDLPRQDAIYEFTQAHSTRLRGLAVPQRTPLRNLRREVTLANFQRPPTRVQDRVEDNLNNFRNLLRSSFRYIKCLGWGGEGVVSLWRYRPDRNRDRLVVFKAVIQRGDNPVPAAQNIDRERDMITMLCRAPHIVQRFFLADNPLTAALPGTRRSTRLKDMGSRVDDTRGRYILMDHCRFGTLHSQLVKAAVDQDPNGTERWFPDSVLWRIFDCLIKACMAMECPPRYVPANAPPAPAPAGGAAPVVPPWTTSLSAGYLPEVVAPGIGTNAGHYGIVHGDLDPRNGMHHQPVLRRKNMFPAKTDVVFVYDYDEPGAGLTPDHTEIPRIQVGDFGAARDEATLWAPIVTPTTSQRAEIQKRRQRWFNRNGGKLNYMLPEQFGKDWDRIPNQQDPSENIPQAWMPPWMGPWAPPPPITSGPGRYTSASNVWHIGMIMKVCMTLALPDQPPWAGRMTSAEPQAPVPLPADQERWTYGWSLLDPNEPWVTRYEAALTDLVAKCLMAKQEFRPTLQQIQTIITQQLAVPANATVPAFWANTFFGQPPRPHPPEDTEFVARINPFWDYHEEVQDWLGRP